VESINVKVNETNVLKIRKESKNSKEKEARRRIKERRRRRRRTKREATKGKIQSTRSPDTF
jgi:hypothetical protein